MKACFCCLCIVLMTGNYICAFSNNQDLQLDLQTGIAINRTVKLRCTDAKSNHKSWYIWKGNNTLLIDDGAVKNEYSLYEIYTNNTMDTMEIEFKRFSLDLLDVYTCVREKGASSNSLDLNDIYKKKSDHAEVKCKNVTAARGGFSVEFQCTIIIDGIICDDNIYWENGNTGEKMFNKEGIYDIVCRGSVSGTFITTSLNIFKVTDEDIRTDFYMVYVNKYQTTKRYFVTFNQESDHAEVKCKNVTAARVGLSVEFQCTIIIDGIICDDNIYWENRNTGEKMFNKEGINDIVCRGSVNGTFITTSLNIFKVTDEDIRTDFYMVYVNKYQTTKRYFVTFNQVLPKKKSNTLVWSSICSVGLVVAIVVTVLLVRKKERIKDCLGKNNYPVDQPHETKPLGHDLENGIIANEDHCFK